MNREGRAWNVVERCVPHARGDEPDINLEPIRIRECSPRAWG